MRGYPALEQSAGDDAALDLARSLPDPGCPDDGLGSGRRFHWRPCERLVNTMPPDLDTVLFVNSGSEANDLAWRLVTAKPKRSRCCATTASRWSRWGSRWATGMLQEPGSQVPASADQTSAIVDRLRERAVLIGATGGSGNVLKIRPPLVFDTTHADLLVEMLNAALDDLTRPSHDGEVPA